MARTIRLIRSAVLVLLGSLSASPVRAQTPAGSAPSTAPSQASQGVGPYGVSALTPDPLLAPEPYPVERPNAASGWYAGVDLGLVKPHVKSRISSGAPLGGAFTDPVQLPVASLNGIVAPRFEAGYRLPDGAGDLRLGYRFLATSGAESSPGNTLKSRLDLNVIDFDYVSSEWLAENWLGPCRDLRLVAGVRMGTAYLSSLASGGAVVESRFSNQFVGAGPHFGLEWSKRLPNRPFEIYSRFDSAGLVGQTWQSFDTEVRNETGQLVGAARRDRPQGNGAAVVSVEVGVGWRPVPFGRTRVVTGYQFEQWWSLGRTDDSNYELTVQGAFLRAEWRY